MQISLRPWRMEDATDLAAMLDDPAVQDNLRDGIPLPYTVQDAGAYIQSCLAADPVDTFAFAITVDDRAIGSIAAFRQGNIHRRTAELGYYVARSHWGRGICARAVSQLCRHLFDTTDLLRIYAEPFAYNAASCRVLEKCGFQFEGTLRQNAVKKGVVLDMKLYSTLKA